MGNTYEPTSECHYAHFRSGRNSDGSCLGDSWLNTLLTYIFLFFLILLTWGTSTFSRYSRILVRRYSGSGTLPEVLLLFTEPTLWIGLLITFAATYMGMPNMAVGFIIGSAIANVLVIYPLRVLLYWKGHRELDQHRSMVVVTLVLVAVTALVAIGAAMVTTGIVKRVLGGVLVAVYLAHLSWTHHRQTADRTEFSSPLPTESNNVSATDTEWAATDFGPYHASGTVQGPAPPPENEEAQPLLTAASLPFQRLEDETNPDHEPGQVLYHLFRLFLGMLASLISAVPLIGISQNMAYCACVSDYLFGITVLAATCTIPSQLLAVLLPNHTSTGGRPEGYQLLTTNAINGSISLLTLCLGVLWLATDGSKDEAAESSVEKEELYVLLGCSVVLACSIFWTGRWWITSVIEGVLMLGAYVVFLVLEYRIIRYGDRSRY